MNSTDRFDAESLRDPDRIEPVAAAIESTDYFVFRLRGRTYALAPSTVDLVVPMQPVVVVPTPGAHIAGVIYLRGRIIAVIDLAALLGIDDQPPSHESARLIVLDAPCRFAFVADATLGLWSFCNAAPSRSADDGPIVSGHIADRGGAATLIDPRAILEHLINLRGEGS
jgi:purine-binding chemotaxis protein CheW